MNSNTILRYINITEEITNPQRCFEPNFTNISFYNILNHIWITFQAFLFNNTYIRKTLTICNLCVKRFILVSKIKRFGENDIRKFNQSNRQCNISVTHKGNESIQTVACTTNSNLITPLKIKFLANNASCSSALTTETTNNKPFVNMKNYYL